MFFIFEFDFYDTNTLHLNRMIYLSINDTTEKWQHSLTDHSFVQLVVEVGSSSSCHNREKRDDRNKGLTSGVQVA